MGACVNSIKITTDPIPSSSSSFKVHDTKLCKKTPEIISLTNFSLGWQELGCSPTLSPGFTQPHLRTVSRRSPLFSSLGSSSRAASFSPWLGRFADNFVTQLTIEIECIALVTDYLLAWIVTLSGAPDWRRKAIHWPNFPLSHLGR